MNNISPYTCRFCKGPMRYELMYNRSPSLTSHTCVGCDYGLQCGEQWSFLIGEYGCHCQTDGNGRERTVVSKISTETYAFQPIATIPRAIEPGISIEKLEALLALVDEWKPKVCYDLPSLQQRYATVCLWSRQSIKFALLLRRRERLLCRI